jgi:hypothetical protein
VPGRLLGVGAGLEVLEPVEMRDRIARRAAAVVAVYGAPEAEPSTRTAPRTRRSAAT